MDEFDDLPAELRRELRKTGSVDLSLLPDVVAGKITQAEAANRSGCTRQAVSLAVKKLTVRKRDNGRLIAQVKGAPAQTDDGTQSGAPNL